METDTDFTIAQIERDKASPEIVRIIVDPPPWLIRNGNYVILSAFVTILTVLSFIRYPESYNVAVWLSSKPMRTVSRLSSESIMPNNINDQNGLEHGNLKTFLEARMLISPQTEAVLRISTAVKLVLYKPHTSIATTIHGKVLRVTNINNTVDSAIVTIEIGDDSHNLIRNVTLGKPTKLFLQFHDSGKSVTLKLINHIMNVLKANTSRQS